MAATDPDWLLVTESGDRVLVAIVGLVDPTVHLAIDDADRDGPEGAPDAIACLTSSEAADLGHRLQIAARLAIPTG